MSPACLRTPQKSPFFTCIACSPFQKLCAKTPQFWNQSPSWCHRGYWCCSPVNDNTSSMVLSLMKTRHVRRLVLCSLINLCAIYFLHSAFAKGSILFILSFSQMFASPFRDNLEAPLFLFPSVFSISFSFLLFLWYAVNMLFSGHLWSFLDNYLSEAATLQSWMKNKDQGMGIIWDL